MRKKDKNFFVIITGPTGVGKTALVEELARISTLRFAVINGDMGQLYQPLSIGTAKPDLSQQTVAHYLFDILDTPRNFTAHEYRTRATAFLEMLWSNNTLPIVVGGSGFYIKSLFFAPHSYTTATTTLLHQEQEYKHYTTAELWHKLNALDPERAANIHVHDRYRIVRALTLYRQTGLLPSTLIPVYAPIGQALILYVTRERQELYTRINQRVDHMFENGWVEEVAQLSGDWRVFIRQKKIIGYPEIIEYLETLETQEQTQELQKLKETIAKNTRAYAKRQQTFWRSFKQALNAAEQCAYKQEIHEINLTFTNLSLYTKQLEHILYTQDMRHMR